MHGCTKVGCLDLDRRERVCRVRPFTYLTCSLAPGDHLAHVPLVTLAALGLVELIEREGPHSFKQSISQAGPDPIVLAELHD